MTISTHHPHAEEARILGRLEAWWDEPPRREVRAKHASFETLVSLAPQDEVLHVVRNTRVFIAILFSLLTFAPAHAVQPDEILANAALEARARVLSQNLRCLVCQNQSIDDSDAPLAKDLRVLLRERLTSGDTDAAATDYIVARYGNFVLLKPPFLLSTALLWLGPLGLLLLTGGGFARYLRQHTDAPAPADLTAEEQARLAQLLGDEPQK